MKATFLFVLLLCAVVARSQTAYLDSLQRELQQTSSEETRIDILNKMSLAYSGLSLPRAEQFATEALDKATLIQYQKGIGAAYNNLGICHSIQGRYTTGLDYFLKALRIREEQKDAGGAARTMNNMTRIFVYQKDYDKAIQYSERALTMLTGLDEPASIGNAYMILGTLYVDKNDYQQARVMFGKALNIFKGAKLKTQQGSALLHIGNTLQADGKYNDALEYCFEAMNFLDLKADLFTGIELYQTIGLIYAGMGDQPDALKYLHTALKMSDQYHDSNGQLSSRRKLSDVFRTFNRIDSALYYQDAYITLREEVFNAEKLSQVETLERVYQIEKKDQLIQASRDKIKTQSVIIVIASILLVLIAAGAFGLYRYSREKKKTAAALMTLNSEVMEKNEEIMAQSEELMSASDEIREINENLEREVHARTEKIKIQNQKLTEYAYFNAHNVRGPLARILGLAMLIEREESPQQLREYAERIHYCALELDSVIREINDKLDEGGDDDVGNA